MSPHTRKIIDQLSKANLDSGPNVQTVMDVLFSAYQDIYPTDPEQIKVKFSHLNDILSKLPLRECDKVWDLTCQLCIDHARFAFQTGVRIGAKLITELEESEREGH